MDRRLEGSVVADCMIETDTKYKNRKSVSVIIIDVECGVQSVGLGWFFGSVK